MKSSYSPAAEYERSAKRFVAVVSTIVAFVLHVLKNATSNEAARGQSGTLFFIGEMVAVVVAVAHWLQIIWVWNKRRDNAEAEFREALRVANEGPGRAETRQAYRRVAVRPAQLPTSSEAILAAVKDRLLPEQRSASEAVAETIKDAPIEIVKDVAAEAASKALDS